MAASMKTGGVKLCQICRCLPASIRHRRFSSTYRSKKLRGVVGLEIHAQIQSKSKLFSGADTSYSGATNDQVALLDAALPGTLPVINRRCVEAGVLTALALNCHVNKVSKFDRKHYFYADLPAGYQITQLRQPLAKGGVLRCPVITEDASPNRALEEITVRLEQIQLEQDSGKSLHDDMAGQSLIDLNRAGVGLMEIITAPDMSSGLEAVSFVNELIGILTTLSTCNCKMEEGALRVDANISVHVPGEPLGTRVEVKNLNSTRSVKRAVDYEIKRQTLQVMNGEKIHNDTRSFDITAGCTLPMRDKEIEQDYRFMPEPNLPPLHVYDNNSVPAGLDPSQVINMDVLGEGLPPLPAECKQHLVEQYDLPALYAHRIVSKPGMYEFYREVVSDTPRNPHSVALRMMADLLAAMNAAEKDFASLRFSPREFGELLDLLFAHKITRKYFQKILSEMMVEPDISPSKFVKDEDYQIITDPVYVEKICREVLDDFTQDITKHKMKLIRNKPKYVSYLTNQTMKKMENRVRHSTVKDTFERIVD